jgi:F-type H+-transporting ATPase subunit delta
MDQSAIAVRYAKALFELAKEQKAEETIFGDMLYLKKLLSEEKKVTQILSSKAISIIEKKGIVKQLLEPSINPLTHKFLIYVIQKRREVFLQRIFLEYIRHFNTSRDLVRVIVKSASPLSQNQLSKIQATVSTQLGKTPAIETSIDSSLIGGYQIVIGDRFYDYSVKGILERIEHSI